jgi:hypothetical protein
MSENWDNQGNDDAPDPEALLDDLLRVVQRDVGTLARKKSLSGFDRKAISDYAKALVTAAAHRRKVADDEKDLDDATPDELERMAAELQRRAKVRRGVTA